MAIVNRRFAQEHWPAGNAVGKRVRLYRGPKPGPWLTVVGVAASVVVNRMLQARLVNVAPTDPVTLAVAAGY